MNVLFTRKYCLLPVVSLRRSLHYIQGQSPKPKVREYFYYIDHQGQLFLDDARIKNFTSCFKEKQFLEFFFKRLKLNDGKYSDEFPYISPCGREMNYIRCDDLPCVFTQILPNDKDGLSEDLFSFCNGGHLLTQPFEPEKVCMLPETGRVYHPGPPKMGGVGLIKSSLAIEFSRYFEFNDGDETRPPVYFTWKGVKYSLTNEAVDTIRLEETRIETLKNAT